MLLTEVPPLLPGGRAARLRVCVLSTGGRDCGSEREGRCTIHRDLASKWKIQNLAPRRRCAPVCSAELLTTRQARADPREHPKCVWPRFHPLTTGLGDGLGNPNRVSIPPLPMAFQNICVFKKMMTRSKEIKYILSSCELNTQMNSCNVVSPNAVRWEFQGRLCRK